ncbi:MAG: NAD(P)-dependent oxidoreductase [Geminicoccaceae bacterium]|nr:NAD(P)-dependent oxidoreductase [Geminicoccaceae bacterium]
MSPRLFVFGLGYTALALARALQAEGWRVAGTTRSAAKQARLAEAGIEAHLFERGRPLAGPAATLAGTSHLLSSVAPDEAGDPVLDQHLADLERCGALLWAGYLGTTGVYGDHGGAWVDEATPVAPTIARTRRRVSAEGHWLASGLPVQIFRLAGIYGPGPGRNALETVRAGTARRIVKPGQLFGRIHVEDIVGVLRASMARPNPGAIYNVADDEPAPPQDVVTFACELLGVEAPPAIPFAAAELSPMAQSFYGDNRRICNARIKEELGVVLRHPSYREGLRSILELGEPASGRATETVP